MSCEHDWQPLLRWSGRYRCEKCRALAYRRVVLPKHAAGAAAKEGEPDTGRPAASFVVYLCTHKRKDARCGKPAVTHGRTQLCAEHAGERS